MRLLAQGLLGMLGAVRDRDGRHFPKAALSVLPKILQGRRHVSSLTDRKEYRPQEEGEAAGLQQQVILTGMQRVHSCTATGPFVQGPALGPDGRLFKISYNVRMHNLWTCIQLA